MGKNGRNGSMSRRAARGSRAPWAWIALVALGVLMVAGGGFWWFAGTREASAGTPRLVVDRERIDLGYQHFGATAHAAFTVTNTGNGVLKILDTPTIRVVKGC